MAARAGDGVRHTLRNREQAVHRLNGTTQRWRIGSAAELRTTLERTFGLDLSGLPEVDAALERVAAG
jgi:arylamine N-acetyltransferase